MGIPFRPVKTEIIKIDSQYPDINRIVHCAKMIRQGGLVIFPTETVYGIAADFSNPRAMQRLREVKKRSSDKPFSILISQSGLISNYTSMTDTALYKLIRAYWPGPLTIIVPPKREGESTMGVRMPDNLIALKLVEESQCTMAAPSANIEGQEPPLTCEEALKDLDGLADAAIDGGTVAIGRSSSVVDLVHGKPTVLREGVITQSDIDRVINKKTVLFVCTGNSCRSVMAEYLLKNKIKGRENIEVFSAGTAVFIRSTASAETISVLREESIDAMGHVSQPINTILLKQSDLIFVMTRTHREQVLERVPAVEKRVYLLKEFANIPPTSQADLDIPDPIGSAHQAYQQCLSIIKEAVDRIEKLV